MKNRLLINTGCSLVIAILVFLILMSNWQMKQLAIYEREQDFTFTVIQKLDRLLDILREAGKGQRNFSRSGDEKYLQSYDSSLNMAEDELVHLQEMAKDHPPLQKKVAAIDRQVKEQRTNFFANLASGAEADKSAAMRANSRLKKLIRQQIAAAKEEAVQHMRLLTAKEQTDFKRMEILLISNSIIICILVITIYFILKREIASRIKMNEHVVMLQEQERLALSREVHDDIGQSLTALKLDLALIESTSQDIGLAERLVDMRTNLDRLLSKTHDITARLRPPLLDNLGLAAAIEWQVCEFRRLSSIDCHIMLNDDIMVCDQHVALAMTRILQEALTNIARHAGATEVSVSMCQRADELILEIADNGCGITAKEVDAADAYGIMGMRERASLCNGKISITGNNGGGTVITLAIPATALEENP